MQKFDPAKPCKTRDGRKARVLATDIRDNAYPLAAAVTSAEDGSESVLYYDVNGQTTAPTASPDDLINLPDPPPLLAFANGTGVRVMPDNPAFVQIGAVRANSYYSVTETDVAALAQWLNRYAASRS